MILNDTVNVFGINGDGYFLKFSGGCMRQGRFSYSVKKYGDVRGDMLTAYIPDVSADIAKGDYIVFGEYAGEFSPDDAHTVQSVSVCDYGSPCMRHIRITAV